MIYFVGRVFQVIGLVTMPSAIWVAEFQHSECGAISIFAGAGFIFIIGMFLTNIRRPKA